MRVFDREVGSRQKRLSQNRPRDLMMPSREKRDSLPRLRGRVGRGQQANAFLERSCQKQASMKKPPTQPSDAHGRANGAMCMDALERPP